jgi:dipeptidyl aminopeptidase/acylaminoacyl peptidase
MFRPPPRDRRAFVAGLALCAIILALACGPSGGTLGAVQTVTPYVVRGTAVSTESDTPVPPTDTPTAMPTGEPTSTPVATEPPPEPAAAPTPVPTVEPTPLPTSPPTPDIVRVYASREPVGATEIFVEYSDGTTVNVTNHPAEDGYPDLSPDGTKIVFASTRAGGPALIHVMNVDGSGVVQLTDVPSGDTLPVWSPDGTRIAFQSLRDHNYEIYVMNADGSGQANLTNHPGKDLEPSWSPDGAQIYFQTDRDGHMYDAYVMNADGSGQAPRP